MRALATTPLVVRALTVALIAAATALFASGVVAQGAADYPSRTVMSSV